jgi:hypothetical protein
MAASKYLRLPATVPVARPTPARRVCVCGRADHRAERSGGGDLPPLFFSKLGSLWPGGPVSYKWDRSS